MIRIEGGYRSGPWLWRELEANTTRPFPNPFPEASVEQELQRPG
jgi:hypothetical protein